MKAVDVECKVAEALGFNSSTICPVGHIFSLKFTDLNVTVEPDLEVFQPDTHEKKKVVAILNKVFWTGKHTDPIKFTGVVSSKSKAKMKSSILNPKAKSEFEIDFGVFDYDKDDEQPGYYRHLHTDNSPFKSIVQQVGGTIDFNVDVERCNDQFGVMEPALHWFTISFNFTQEYELQWASSITEKLVLQAGINAKT